MTWNHTDKKSLFLKWVLFVITVFLGYELFVVFEPVHSGWKTFLWFYVILPMVLIGIAMIGCPRSVWPTVKELPDKVTQTVVGISLFLFVLIIAVLKGMFETHNAMEVFLLWSGIFYLILLFIWQPHVFGRCHKWIKGVMRSLLFMSLIYIVILLLLVGVAFF